MNLVKTKNDRLCLYSGIYLSPIYLFCFLHSLNSFNTNCFFVPQERLYQEIQNVCGQEQVTEDMLSKLPYLVAVFHETLRKHSPAPIVPLRYAHEDTQLGGYYIPAGSEVNS